MVAVHAKDVAPDGTYMHERYLMLRTSKGQLKRLVFPQDLAEVRHTNEQTS